MPRIPGPVSRPKLPGTIFTAAGQGALAAQGAAQIAGALGEVGEALEQRKALEKQRRAQEEISQLNVGIAKLRADTTVALNKAGREGDPNDPNFAENFRNNVIAPQLADLGQFATTDEAKRHFATLGAGFSGDFLIRTEGVQQANREQAAAQNHEVFLNQLGDSVVNDPASFEATRISGDIAIDGLAVSQLDKRALKTNKDTRLALLAASGLIEQDPQNAKERIDAGEFSEFISGEEKQRLIDQADRAIKARIAEAEAARKKASDARLNGLISQAINLDGSTNTEDLSALDGQIFNNPNFTPEEKRAAFRFTAQLRKQENEGSSAGDAVYEGLLQRSVLSRGDPNKTTIQELTVAMGDGDLTAERFNSLVKLVGGKGTPEQQLLGRARNRGLQTAKEVITGNAGQISFIFDQNKALDLQEFTDFALTEEIALEQRGIPAADIWAIDGPILSQMDSFVGLGARRAAQRKAEAAGPVSKRDQQKLDRLRAAQERLGGIKKDVPPPPKRGPDPFAPADPLIDPTPLGTIFQGKPVLDLTTAEMDKLLNEINKKGD